MTHASSEVQGPKVWERSRLAAFWVMILANAASMVRWQPGLGNLLVLLGTVTLLFPNLWSDLVSAVVSRGNSPPDS